MYAEKNEKNRIYYYPQSSTSTTATAGLLSEFDANLTAMWEKCVHAV